MAQPTVNKLAYAECPRDVAGSDPKYVALCAPRSAPAAVWRGGMQLFSGANAQIMAHMAAGLDSSEAGDRATKRARVDQANATVIARLVALVRSNPGKALRDGDG